MNHIVNVNQWGHTKVSFGRMLGAVVSLVLLIV